MGLLGDVYSYGDTLKRKVGGLLSDPRGTLEQFVGQLGDDMNTNISNMKTGYGFGGNKSVLSDPAQVQAAQRALADYGAQSGMAAATVWHGSPHKFDKFDSSKIGTGEGAQAYGHGLYLAESPQVATQYRDALSDADAFVQGKPFNNADPIHRAAAAIKEAKDNGNPIESVIARLKRSAEGLKSRGHGWATELADEQMGTVRALESGKVPSFDEVSKGQLYKVDLPDEHIAKMLDWDRAMVDQPDIYKKIAQEKGLPHRGNTPKGGMDIYNSLIDELGSPAAATDFLRNAGIPGIRYLDGGSRGAGQGSSNFVVFPGNEGLLSILERNGQALK